MKIVPTIIHVRASKDLKFLEINAGRCPVTGKPRADYVVEEHEVVEFFLTPAVVNRVLDMWPESADSDPPEAFQVKVTWID
jgi:hypothetical protein